jgi:hypothetical protein
LEHDDDMEINVVALAGEKLRSILKGTFSPRAAALSFAAKHQQPTLTMASSYPQQSFNATSFPDDSFWGVQIAGVRTATLKFQLDMLKKTGRYDAFKLQWHPSYGDPPTHWPVPNHLFWDSDVAKWIEGAVYSLASQPDDAIEKAVEELVDMIRGAQQEDGYLNIHFTVVAPEGRFTNLRDLHELFDMPPPTVGMPLMNAGADTMPVT